MALSLDSQMVRLALLSSMESVSGRQLGVGGCSLPPFPGDETQGLKHTGKVLYL